MESGKQIAGQHMAQRWAGNVRSLPRQLAAWAFAGACPGEGALGGRPEAWLSAGPEERLLSLDTG